MSLEGVYGLVTRSYLDRGHARMLIATAGYSLFPQNFHGFHTMDMDIPFFLARAPQSVITDAWSQWWVTSLGQTLPALQHHRLLPANVLGRGGPVG